MDIDRIWEMPNSKTFQIKGIKDFILDNIKGENLTIIDPFANEHSIKDSLTNQNYICNDLDKDYNCDYNMDAYDFLKMFEDGSVDIVLFDPPYSTRQVSECYTKSGKNVTSLDTSAQFWSKLKKEVSRIVKTDGIVFGFGWNTCGIGKNNGFEMEKIRIICHGSYHNDTLCTMERKQKVYRKVALFDLED